MKIIYEQRKSFPITYSGRSSDFISPKFARNCIAKCEYCYMHRHTPHGEVRIASNIDTILEAIAIHQPLFEPKYKKPNQTHEKYCTYDIGCLSDFSIDANYLDWKKIFNYSKYSETDMFTFATKFFNKNFLEYNSNQKVRIRLSLNTPTVEKLEIGTNSMIVRLNALEALFQAGYEVHINISPIIAYRGAKEEYKILMNQINECTSESFKKQCGFEYIFLTNHEKQMMNASMYGKELMKFSNEKKPNGAMRYPFKQKQKLIKTFISLHEEIMNWGNIRYIF